MPCLSPGGLPFLLAALPRYHILIMPGVTAITLQDHKSATPPHASLIYENCCDFQVWNNLFIQFLLMIEKQSVFIFILRLI